MVNLNPDTSGLNKWQPGESGNPDGRPKGSKNFTTLVRDALEEITNYKDEQGQIKTDTYKRLLIKRILNKAIDKGDTRMIELIWNYFDGKPRGSLDVGVDKESLGELTAFFRKIGSPAADTPAENPDANL